MQMAELHSWNSLYQVVQNDSLIQSLSQIVFLTNYGDPKSMLTLIFLISKETQQDHNLFYSRIQRCTCSFNKVCDNSLKLRLIHQSKSQHLDVSLHQSRFTPKIKPTDQNNMLMRTTPLSDQHTKI